MAKEHISKKQHKSSISRHYAEHQIEEDQTQAAATALSNFDTHDMTPDKILTLQSTIGNAAVQRLISNRPAPDTASTSVNQSSSDSSIQRGSQFNPFKKKKLTPPQRFKKNAVKIRESGDTVEGNPIYNVVASGNDLFARRDQVILVPNNPKKAAVFDKKGVAKFVIMMRKFEVDPNGTDRLLRIKKLDKFRTKHPLIH